MVGRKKNKAYIWQVTVKSNKLKGANSLVQRNFTKIFALCAPKTEIQKAEFACQCLLQYTLHFHALNGLLDA